MEDIHSVDDQEFVTFRKFLHRLKDEVWFPCKVTVIILLREPLLVVLV